MNVELKLTFASFEGLYWNLPLRMFYFVFLCLHVRYLWLTLARPIQSSLVFIVPLGKFGLHNVAKASKQTCPPVNRISVYIAVFAPFAVVSRGSVSFHLITAVWPRLRKTCRSTRSCLPTDFPRRTMNTSSIWADHLTPHLLLRTGGVVEEETSEAEITGNVPSAHKVDPGAFHNLSFT